MREFLNVLPQRPPFLFVTEVVEQSSDEIVTIYVASKDEPYFQGHFPGRPIMPGVLQCECCLQAGAILLAGQGEKSYGDGLPVATRIMDARFKRIVRPGDRLIIRTSIEDREGSAFYLKSEIKVEEKTVARVKTAVMIVEDSFDN